MTVFRSHHRLRLAGVALVSALVLSACTTGSPTPPNQGLPTAPPPPAPATIAPVTTTQVSATDLPPLAGTTTGVPPMTAATGTPGFDAAGTAAGGMTAGGRTLSGPLSMDMLLGGWTVTAGATECRLNLTYTARGATGRYRASSPSCANPVLAGVASWQLLGTQVQLYDANDALIATLAQSGNRFLGTLSGGTSIVMVG